MWNYAFKWMEVFVVSTSIAALYLLYRRYSTGVSSDSASEDIEATSFQQRPSPYADQPPPRVLPQSLSTPLLLPRMPIQWLPFIRLSPFPKTVSPPKSPPLSKGRPSKSPRMSRRPSSCGRLSPSPTATVPSIRPSPQGFQHLTPPPTGDPPSSNLNCLSPRRRMAPSPPSRK
jgi:hypothetical protein